MLTAALIGTGSIARQHLAAISSLRNVTVVAVCDLSPARVEAAAERFGIAKWYTDYHRMLRETPADLVHITTPAPSHHAIARDCLNAGFNVLCEKPIVNEYEQFVELREAASRKGLVLLENQNYRFNAPIQRILRLASAAELGEIVDVQVQVSLNLYGKGSRYADPNLPHPCLSMRGGAVGDFLTHMAYLAFIFVGTPAEVRTLWLRRVPAMLPTDEFRALISAERGTASLSFSGNSQPNGFWVRVFGTRAHVETNLFEPPRLTVRRHRPGPPPIATFIDGIEESREVLRGAVGGLRRKLAGATNYDGLFELVDRVYSALQQNKKQPISLDEIDAVARLVSSLTRDDLRL